MLSALLYLRLTSLRNWLVSRARRLRQPKYLIGAVVGIAYFYFFFFRGLGPRAPRATPHPLPPEALEAMAVAQAHLPVDWLPATTALGTVALLIIATLMWVVPVQRAALGFSEAEIAFLFPAPITRRGLVHFRLLSSQFRSLVGAAVMMLFSNRWTIVGGNALTHAIGWWFIFSTLNLHFNAANFTLTRLADLGLGVWRRRTLILTAVAVVVVTTIARLPATSQPAPGQEFDLAALTQQAVAFTGTAPLAWLLWPLQLVLGPFLAVSPAGFFAALGPALAIVTLHYLWVVRTAIAFEDSSVDEAQKRGARIAQWRAGGRRPGAPTKGRPGPFPLRDVGRPELAFLWKNLLSTWPYFTVKVWLAGAALIVAVTWWLQSQPDMQTLAVGAGGLALMFAAYTSIVGPQFARQDIRSDLANVDILKTYPLAGWQIILGELLAPVAILTGILWLMLLAAGLTLHPGETGPDWLTAPLRLTGAMGLALIAPALVTLQLLVPNAAALLFPGWFHATRTRGGGPEVIGQRMIFFFAQLLAMVIALLPPAGLAALLIFILQWLLGPTAAVALASLMILAVLVGEIGCTLWWLGQRFERLDLSAELRA
jgi:hypothetical protein